MSDVPPSPSEPFRPLPDRSWRERVDDVIERAHAWGRSARLLAAAGAAVCVVVVMVALLRPASADPRPDASLPRASDESTASSSATPSTAPVLVVQAAGAVLHPGLYRLPSGARVDDLVSAAGGLASDADADRVNLAAPLLDGQKVFVPRVGQPVPPDATVGTGSTHASQPIDLNTAAVEQLDSLPGIGPTTAQAIIDYRTEHGRFRSVDDLLHVRGIGPAKLDQIRALVTVS